jgi:hypothetical protein
LLEMLAGRVSLTGEPAKTALRGLIGETDAPP